MITASIVTYLTPLSELDTCYKALSSGHVARLYIIDNGRDDKVRRWCVTRNRERERLGDNPAPPQIIYIPSPNRGYGSAHNRALTLELTPEKVAECPYHLVMNSDVKFLPSIIASIEEFMDRNPRVGTLQPRLISPGGEEQNSCRSLPHPSDLFIKRFMPASRFAERRDRYMLRSHDRTKTWNIPFHQGSFMFMRKEALLDTGIFDERFFLYAEDVDLSRRLHVNWLTLYWPHVTVTHFHRASSYHSLKMMLIHTVSMCRYFNKWGWLHDQQRDEFNSAIAEYPAAD